MDVKTALAERKSTRAFLDKDVSKNVINKIINQAKTAPSGVNTQPWQVAVLTGAVKIDYVVSLKKPFEMARKALWIISTTLLSGWVSISKEEKSAVY